MKAATVDDEESDNLPLALTSAPEIDDTGSDEVNNATGGDERSDDLMVCICIIKSSFSSHFRLEMDSKSILDTDFRSFS